MGDQGKLPLDSFKIVASDTIIVTRAAGSNSAQAQVAVPTGANLMVAEGTLTNASPLLTFPVQYLAPDGSGGVLWGIRAYYDASVGVIKVFNESFNASVTASTYIVAVKYYLLSIPFK